MANALIIVGMHRSGTSALTGLLQLAGIDLGKNLIPAGEDNPKGFFEHNDIWQIHHRLLRELGSDWDDTRSLPSGWDHTDLARQAQDEIRSVVTRDFGGSRLWAVKDPRLSRIFPIWPSILDNIGVTVNVVLALRHPLEVAQSIARRDKLELPHALGMWLRYTLDAEIATRSTLRIVSHYPDLLSDWRATLQQIEQQFMLDPLPLSPGIANEISNFLDVGLRHHHTDSEWPHNLAQTPLARWCATLFQAMLDLPAQESIDTIDLIRSEIAEAENHTQFFVSQMRDDITAKHRLEKSAMWLEGERQQHLTVIKQLEYDLRHREADLLVAKSELSALRKERDLLNDERLVLERECARQAEDIRQLSADWLGAQQRIEAIYRSRSWLVTKPIRATSRMLRRILSSDRQPVPPNGSGQEPVPLMMDSTQEEEENDLPPTPTVILPRSESQEAPAISVRPAVFDHAKREPIHSPEALRIIIITPDLHGPIRNGGIGTAFSALARWLVQEGHGVTILYALGQHTESEPLDHWQGVYDALGVTLLVLPDELTAEGAVKIEGPQFGQIAWRVHDWLKIRGGDYDLAIFPEWSGIAFHVLRAKQHRTHYRNLQIMINTHSPESWSLEGNHTLPENPDFLERDFMERESVAMADWVISPSHYMLSWMRQHQWDVPEIARVIPNLADLSPREVSAQKNQPATDIVFFGRLEIRKGLALFCDAIDRLPDEDRHRIGRIIFLGKPVARHGFNSVDYINHRTTHWSTEVEIWPNFNRDQALAALQSPGVLAVIASLCENSPYTVVECLHDGIAFVATNVGGIPELIDEGDHDRILFDPNPGMLASRLISALGQCGPLPSPAHSPAKVEEQWSSWLSEVYRKCKSPPVTEAPGTFHRPKVSVCLVHFERPALLRQSLSSIRAQTYRNFEVILVDDGSKSPEALAMLNDLDAEFKLRDWKIIRQPNLYLGAARNRAASEATGDFLLFMDDDNIALPREIETFVKTAQITGADILTSACYIFDTAEPPPQPDRMWIPLGNAPSVAVFRNVFGDANAFWKRSSFLKLNGFSTDYGVGHEDWEIFTEAVLNGLSLEVVQEPLFYYRVHPNSMIRSGNLWADHARSARAFLRNNPSGLGMACAYSTGMNILRN